MEEKTGSNGFEPSDYANGLYEDSKVNSQRRDRSQRRLDKLTREQRQDLKYLKNADFLPIYALFIENTHPDITHEWVL